MRIMTWTDCCDWSRGPVQGSVVQYIHHPRTLQRQLMTLTSQIGIQEWMMISGEERRGTRIVFNVITFRQSIWNLHTFIQKALIYFFIVHWQYSASLRFSNKMQLSYIAITPMNRHVGSWMVFI